MYKKSGSITVRILVTQPIQCGYKKIEILVGKILWIKSLTSLLVCTKNGLEIPNYYKQT